MSSLFLRSFILLVAIVGDAFALNWSSGGVPPTTVASGVSYNVGGTHTTYAGTIQLKIFKNGTYVGGNGQGGPRTYRTLSASYTSVDNGNQTITYKIESWSDASSGSWLKDGEISGNTFVNTDPIQALDSATYANGTISLSGWAADAENGAAVARVEVFLDGVYKGNASLGGYRPDVANYYARPDYTNSGFSFAFSATDVSPGTHEVRTRVVDSWGAHKDAWQNVTVTNAAPVLTAFSVSPQTVYVGQPQVISATVTDVDRNMVGHGIMIQNPAGGGWKRPNIDYSAINWNSHAIDTQDTWSNANYSSSAVAAVSSNTRTITFTGAVAGNYQAHTNAIDITGWGGQTMVHDTPGSAPYVVSFNVANPPSGTITADHSILYVGQSTTIRADLFTDAARGDALLQSAINIVDGTEWTVTDYNAVANRTWTFAPTHPGTYTFKAYARTTLTSDWTVYATCTVTVPNQNPSGSYTFSSHRNIGETISVNVTVGDSDGNFDYAQLWVWTPNRGWLIVRPNGSTVANGSWSRNDAFAYSPGSYTLNYTLTLADGFGTYKFELGVMDTAGASISGGPTQQSFSVANRPTVVTASAAASLVHVDSTINMSVRGQDADGNARYFNLDETSPHNGYYGPGSGPFSASAPVNNGSWDLGSNSSDYTRTLAMSFPNAGLFTFRGAVHDGSGWHYSGTFNVRALSRPTVTLTPNLTTYFAGDIIAMAAAYTVDGSGLDPLTSTAVNVFNEQTGGTTNGAYYSGNHTATFTTPTAGNYTFHALAQTQVAPAWTIYKSKSVQVKRAPTGSMQVLDAAQNVLTPSSNQVSLPYNSTFYVRVSGSSLDGSVGWALLRMHDGVAALNHIDQPTSGTSVTQVFGPFTASRVGPWHLWSHIVDANAAGWDAISPWDGNHYGWATMDGTPNLLVTKAAQATVTISPASSSVVVGQSITFTASGGSGTGAYTWGGDASGVGSSKTVTFNTPGSRTVTVYRAGDGNYNASNTATATITVNRIATTFSVNGPFAYNGTQRTVTITPNPANATFTSGGTMSATNAGTYTATATATGNYTGSNSSLTWTINKAAQGTVAISPTTSSVVVGGSITFTASGGSGSGAYTWGGNASGTGSSKAVTFNTAGTRTVTVYRAADGNYNASSTKTATITVTGIATTFSVNGPFTYDGTQKTITITPNPANATFTSGGSLSAINAGNYTATATANGNYSGSNNTLVWTINKAAQGAVAISPTTGSVNVGQSITFTASGGSGTGAYTWGGDASGTGSSKTVTFNTGGPRTVTVYRATDGNYNASNTVTATVAVNGDDDGDGILNDVEQQLGTYGRTTSPDADNETTQLKLHKPE